MIVRINAIYHDHTGEIKDYAWEKSSLNETQEKARGEQTAIAADLRLDSCDKAPKDADGWKKDPRADSVQDQIRWQLG